jgi:ABC-type uncharacterized transport system ATPase subunit
MARLSGQILLQQIQKDRVVLVVYKDWAFFNATIVNVVVLVARKFFDYVSARHYKMS